MLIWTLIIPQINISSLIGLCLSILFTKRIQKYKHSKNQIEIGSKLILLIFMTWIHHLISIIVPIYKYRFYIISEMVNLNNWNFIIMKLTPFIESCLIPEPVLSEIKLLKANPNFVSKLQDCQNFFVDSDIV